MVKNINKIIITIIILVIIISTLFIPVINSEGLYQTNEESSYFGKREAPTSGASTYHKGVDIPAPEGTNLIATCDGEITFTGFLGGGGYTITITNPEGLKISYCHVSPTYIVKKGDDIKQGQLIGHVGPKYVDNVPGNMYTDSTGRHTNGATTGCHLHIGFRLNNEYLNPLEYLQ